jgi:alpha,alpha-trehalase
VGLLEPAPGALQALLAAVDRDGDLRITVLDQGDFVFDCPSRTVAATACDGVSPLANLVQELTLAERAGAAVIRVDRITRTGGSALAAHPRALLGRAHPRIDAASLDAVLPDQKLDGRSARPRPTRARSRNARPRASPRPCPIPVGAAGRSGGVRALRRMTDRHPLLVVCRLPQQVTPEWVAALDGGDERGSRHGLLALASGTDGPRPYVVPGGRFNELYGWDSYFTSSASSPIAGSSSRAP